jgi:S1-C subfamily serine protease
MNNKFTELTRSKMGAVVQIYAEGYAGDEVRSILNPRLGDLRDWSGSGFFINSEYGEDIIITNAHVAKNAKSLEIMTMLTSEETFQVELVGLVKNNEPDIAVLKLKKGELKKLKSIARKEIPYLSLRKEMDMTRGTAIKAIGYPMGMSEPNITGGEVTNFISGNRIFAKKYVTDAAINPGNSGGPAIDEDGFVVGINTSVYQEAENIGFITPFMFINIILKNIFENNSVCFSDISGSFQKNSKEVASAFGMKEDRGIIVKSVEKGGFLDVAGVKVEDVILSFNNLPVDRHGIFITNEYYHRRNIFDAFKLIPIGETVTIEVWRKNNRLKLEGITSSFVEHKIGTKPVIKERDFIDIWGMTVQVLTYEILESFNAIDINTFYQLLNRFDYDKERLIVTYIEKESPAYDQEWTPGEVLTSINGKPVKDLKHFVSILNDDSELYKVKSEEGTLGFFKHKKNQKEVTLLNPTNFLK